MSSTWIPAGSEVVISRNGTEEWYTTQKDVSIDHYQTATCPLRPKVQVMTATVHGFQIWFLENQIEVRLTPEQKSAAENMRLVCLEYDVPAVVSRRPQDYPDENGNSFQHPSQWMWTLGVRTTQSVWVLPKGSIPMRRLQRLTRSGCQWRVTQIDVSDAATHIQRAIVALRREREEAHQRADESRRSAEERFQSPDGDPTAKRLKREKDMKLVEQRLAKALENIVSGAKALKIPLSWLERGAILPTVQAQNQVMERRVELHCNAVDTLNATGHTAVANAVATGAMQEDIAADYMEENGIADDETVFSLRDVFKD